MLKLALLAVSSSLALGEVLFSQPPIPELQGLISHSNGQQAADLFEVGQPSQIQTVRWTGFFLPETADPLAVQFRISFHEGSRVAISPTPFSEVTLRPATVATTFISVSDNPRFPVHSLQAVLPAPVFVEGSKPYWISIVDVTSSAFQWHQGQDLINNWASRGGAGRDDTWLVFESQVGLTGLAVTLEGVAVSEPGVGALSAIAGALSLLCFKLRRA